MLESRAMRFFDVAIVGAGVMGAAAACELAREGASVVLIDQSAIPNPRAASVDHSKVFRFAYPDPFYVKLAVDALSRWRELESTTGTRLLTQTGALLIGKREPSFETECYEAIQALGLQSELLDSRVSAQRFPQFNSRAFTYGVYDPSGGILRAETAVRALVEVARHRGVSVIEGTRVVGVKQAAGSRLSIATETGPEIECRRAMIASGPWSRKLLRFLENELTTTRQELVYFEPNPERSNSNFEDKDFIESCRAFFSEFIPDLADARVCETRVCMYNNTPDDDFIIDWHPDLKGVLIVTGFSGHGFKFGPTIGRIATDLLISGSASIDVDRFRLTRFNNNMR
jgi:glycine/D-amino acid oxidase-like deaminating enzyme